jgi:hypothetical protein
MLDTALHAHLKSSNPATLDICSTTLVCHAHVAPLVGSTGSAMWIYAASPHSPVTCANIDVQNIDVHMMHMYIYIIVMCYIYI